MAHRILLVLLLALSVASCGAPKAADGPKATSSGRVMERAEGFEASPDWAQKDAPWSESNGVLSVVGHVEVAGNQRLEMAYRAADSYARAELLRFLKTHVVSVIEESTKSSGGESVREQVEEQAQALTDDWLIAARYWEKRWDGKKERLDVYSRMDVDQESVTALFAKAALTDDLRLTLSKRLTAVWPELSKQAISAAPDAHAERGITPPEWARSGDQDSGEAFSFVCQGSAAEEGEALSLAKARCDEKLCRLLGVRIQARTSVTETLEELSAESQVSEQCDARIVGRAVTNKGGECGPSGCVFWLRQTYPKTEYEKELARLEAPQVIVQEVVIQEGDKHYKDPSACEAALRSYAQVSEGAGRDSEAHLSASAFQSRVRSLKQALGFCQGIDGRDSGLFQALNTLLLDPIPTFINEGETWNGKQTARAYFVYAPAGFRRDLETKRFLTDRIQAILSICQDAILPMRVFDLPLQRRNQPFTVEEVQAAAAVLDELAEVPLGGPPLRPSYLPSLHSIVMSPFYGRFPPTSSKYRKMLLTELERGKLLCTSSRGISGDEVIEYLSWYDGIDDEEWSTGLTFLTRVQDRHLEDCFQPLLPNKTPAKAKRARAKQLTVLILSGKVAQTFTDKAGKTTRPAKDVELLQGLFRLLPPEDQLSAYLDIRAQLDLKDEENVLLGSHVTEANFQSSRGYGTPSDPAQCEALPERLGPVLLRAPELQIKKTMTCSCMKLEALPASARAALRKLWLSKTDERCYFFQPAEHPDGDPDWPRAERHWQEGPFSRREDVLRQEERACDSAVPVSGLEFSPVIHATLTAGRLTKVSVQGQPRVRESLSQMTWNKAPAGRDKDEWVRKADVETVTKDYEACLRAAAEGYQVAPTALQSKETSTRRVWLEMGDQGQSSGFDE